MKRVSTGDPHRCRRIIPRGELASARLSSDRRSLLLPRDIDFGPGFVLRSPAPRSTPQQEETEGTFSGDVQTEIGHNGIYTPAEPFFLEAYVKTHTHAERGM